MITYQVPLQTYPDTYNGQPLMYAALASQKNHMAVYMTGIYMDEKAREEFETAYRATGKRRVHRLHGSGGVRGAGQGRPLPP